MYPIWIVRRTVDGEYAVVERTAIESIDVAIHYYRDHYLNKDDAGDEIIFIQELQVVAVRRVAEEIRNVFLPWGS